MNFLLTQIKKNFLSLKNEWAELQDILVKTVNVESFNKDDAIVKNNILQNLAIQVEKLKAQLFTILAHNKEIVTTKIGQLESELHEVTCEKNETQVELMHWKSQLDTAMTDIQKEKQEHIKLKSELLDLTTKLTKQSEFCCSLGAACCTLLWRISRQEVAIETLVSGSKSVEFLDLISTSIQGYLSAYNDSEWPEQNTDEAIFLLSICGIITNIAATAKGREYLASCPEGCTVMDTFLSFICTAPLCKSAQIKTLMLMSLYNFSINCKGIRYLCTRKDLIPLLTKHLKDEKDQENQVSTLRLLQSLISDDTYVTMCSSDVLQHLQKAPLQQLTKSSNKDIQNTAKEILSDLSAYRVEN